MSKFRFAAAALAGSLLFGGAVAAAVPAGAAPSVVVTPIVTATSLVSSVNPSLVGESVTFTATVSAVPTVALETLAPPLGVVTFSSSVDGPLGFATLVPISTTASQASISHSFVPKGSRVITAAYGGGTSTSVDAAFSPSSHTLTQLVVATMVTCPAGYTFSATRTGAAGEIAATGGVGWCELNVTPTVTPTPTATVTQPGVVVTQPAIVVAPNVTVVPAGAVGTGGGGSLGGGTSAALVAAGAVLVLAGAGTGAWAIRRRGRST